MCQKGVPNISFVAVQLKQENVINFNSIFYTLHISLKQETHGPYCSHELEGRFCTHESTVVQVSFLKDVRFPKITKCNVRSHQ